MSESTFDYWDGDTHIYVETTPNGDKLVSEYGNGWQKAYVRTKAWLDYLKDNEQTPSLLNERSWNGE